MQAICKTRRAHNIGTDYLLHIVLFYEGHLQDVYAK